LSSIPIATSNRIILPYIQQKAAATPRWRRKPNTTSWGISSLVANKNNRGTRSQRGSQRARATGICTRGLVIAPPERSSDSCPGGRASRQSDPAARSRTSRLSAMHGNRGGWGLQTHGLIL